ncbi:YuzD family protein [Aquibacillus albus]|uniref:Disulfide oxidoreductase YuzD n=1 Tax=Aquibacillus albus TaxID=1168171 RepID=A0ABS2MYH7_9BACI|nr:YuzD family protein [Aquibacillus albus]MBM7570936.1 disulfide oxidoreductase YuzD [Aquibacillus albus]
MNQSPVTVTVYGAEKLCASCVGAPSSKETYEWLQAAISRKFKEATVQYNYVDIYNPPDEKVHRDFSKRVIEEDLFYPVVLVDDEIVGEGIPTIKPIYHALEKKGMK